MSIEVKDGRNMKNINFRLWALYVLAAVVVSTVVTVVIGLLRDGVPSDLLSRSLFMGLIMGTGLYFWDSKSPKKK